MSTTRPSSILLSDNFETENGGNPAPSYFKFINWNVTDGNVDLFKTGTGISYRHITKPGLYLDLDGSGPAGRLESKSTFEFNPGDEVTLSFSLAGAGRLETNSVEVSLGSLFNKTFTIEEVKPFTEIIETFTVDVATSGKLVFDHAGGDRVGLALDDVELKVNSEKSLQLTGTIRDFQDSHPDFEGITGIDRGIVKETLGIDKKPIYAGQQDNPTTNGQQYFDQWFRDVNGVNQSQQYAITLEDPDGDGIFTYTNNAFYPIDNELFGNEGRSHNYHFTYELHSQFTYQGGETFSFFGDDDLFVFIDDKQVIDLGGIHPTERASVNLDDLDLTLGETYDFDLFFAERHTTQSTFQIETSIDLKSKPPESLTVKGTDAIFLAGRADIIVPPLGQSSSMFPLVRHGVVRTDFLQETFPQSVPVQSGDMFAFEASGEIDFFNGRLNPFNPDGSDRNGSQLFGLEGISGYQGTAGALVGLFLTDESPVGKLAPETLNFSSTGLGKAFVDLKPDIGQIFFIGDGRTGTGSGDIQRFTAPTGATRLFLGIADGLVFNGRPGFYEDNDGSYEVAISKAIVGTSDDETLTGGFSNDTIIGLRGDDTLLGDAGKDIIIGGYGDDTLKGGTGRDSFVFDIGRNFRSVYIGTDIIEDFEALDKIVLDKTTFAALEVEPVSFDSTSSRTRAEKSSALIVYDRSAGALYYNENGREAGFGSGGQFATLTNKFLLTASNFTVQV